MRNLHNTIASLLVLYALASECCHCIRFSMQPNTKRCIMQEMIANQLAVGEYEVPKIEGQIIEMKIVDTKGHIALHRDKIAGRGKYAITSEKSDYYDLCFTYSTDPTSSTPFQPIELFVDYRVGAEAKKYEPIDHDRMASLELDLEKITDFTEAIVKDFAHLKRRSREMRDTNDSTKNRLFYQSISSIIILSVLTTWQIVYLRTFFKARKLID